MEVAVRHHSTESHGVVYSLGMCGLADDADKTQIFAQLQKTLRLDQNGVADRLRNSRENLAEFSTHDEARHHQLILGDLGCVTVVQKRIAIGDWRVEAKLADSLEHRIQRAEEGGGTVAVALLRSTEGRVGADLAKKLEQRAQQDCIPVSDHEILLHCLANTGKGAVNWLKNILQSLRQSEAGIPDFTPFVALCPEDGRDIYELHHAFAKQQGDNDRGEELESFAVPANLWPLAGSAWHNVLSLGEAALTDDIPSSVREYVHAYWPADSEAVLSYQSSPRADAASAGGGRMILRNFSLGSDARRLTRGRILQKVRGLKELPTLPVMAMRAYQLAQSADSNANELAGFVEKEPALSARILGIVNSPYFGLSTSVDSIKHALILLGWEEIAHLALLLSSKAVFSGGRNGVGQKLWRHAAQSAEVARLLALRVPDTNASRLYTAALLHDVGKVCLHLVANEEMQSCEKYAVQLNLPQYEIERERLGVDHAEVSGMLLRHWGLPESLCAVIERHHGCWPGEPQLLRDAALLGLVDHITHRIEGTEQHGDLVRIHRVHATELEPFLGEFSLVATDLIADDLKSNIREVVS